MATLAAVDLGAQSGRVAVGRFDGEHLSVTDVLRFPNVPIRIGQTLNWDILRLYQDVLDGLRAAAQEAGRIDSVAVDSWGVDFALIDSRGRLMQNPVHYRDSRRARAVEAVLARVPARELYSRTGVQLMPINTIFELGAMAAEADPALDAAETLLLIPDLFHYWLCGTSTSELTNATTTGCFDPRAGGWATDLLERLGVPPRILPEVVLPATRLGPLTAAMAEETGLKDADVIAVATHDTSSAVAAVPLLRAGSVFISAGTWSLVGVELAAPAISDESFAANLSNEGGVNDTFCLLQNVTGLWLLNECRRCWAKEGLHLTFDELVELADGAAPLRSLIDPNHPSFVSPGDMPTCIREFCAKSGQAEPDDPPAIVRCVLESLALKHAEAVEVLGAVTGTAPVEIHVVGGGARNSLLCKWTAEASGLPVLVGPEEATLLGNLLVQAIALGEIGSVTEAREVVRSSFAPVVHDPGSSSAWQEARNRFASLSGGGHSTLEVIA